MPRVGDVGEGKGQSLRKTVGEGAEMTICDDKENAPRHKRMSRSILKAQNEQVQFKPYSANAEDQFGGVP